MSTSCWTKPLCASARKMLCATDRLLQTELPPAKHHAGLFSQIHTLAAVALKQLHADVPASTDKWTINGYLPNICSGRYNCLFERRSSIAPPMWGCGARETLFGYMKYVAHPNEWFESLIREHAKRLALPIAPRERPRAVSVATRHRREFASTPTPSSSTQYAPRWTRTDLILSMQ